MPSAFAHHLRVALLLGGLGLAACAEEESPPPSRPVEGAFARLGEIMPLASVEERAGFERGRALALRHFVPREGLGPELNAVSCVSCHERPEAGGGGARYRDFHQVGALEPSGLFRPLGRNGIQRNYLHDPAAASDSAREPTDPRTNVLATRHPIPFFGAGLIALIPEAEILKHADPFDRDRDGIRGRPNRAEGVLGRFGRKAQNTTLEVFVRAPLINHQGLTTNPLSVDALARLPFPTPPAAEEPTTDEDGVADPEVSQDQVFDLVLFSMLLAAPLADSSNAEVERGQARFREARCNACHIESLETPRGSVPLYSDLLLHEMGEELADGVVMALATGSDFRTQPLWGVAAAGPWLHDGRADTLDEAIRAHGGEGSASRDAYAAMSEGDRLALLAFLESLGGRDQRSGGRLRADEATPLAGEVGGPMPGLDASALALFTMGRRLFDRDFARGAGLGPRFNGDSCRACHFEPIIGGAGPIDVDVIHQARMEGENIVVPAGGSLVHRFDIALDVRPEPDPLATIFEARQTPPLFGAGLIDSIPEAQLLGREDPEDGDGDGVSGRAHRLADGRLGRFGWKANVPSLAEFLRDALANEVGVTVPSDVGARFGATSDVDSVADPEITSPELDAILMFMQSLAPLPRRRVEIGLEDQGEAVFARVGCASCHANYTDGAGAPIPLYSDLLLHDVAPPGARGVPEGMALPRELRTPPLWGVSMSAPYLHDGRAQTLEDAVIAHDGEARNARDGVMALSAEERRALFAFLGSI